ncbi:hypothetical protein FQN57_000897 [Myotisia sp. PD_48]|nr:hypothetical protein FQN57_000897 [Myotisia sp. PD_48]
MAVDAESSGYLLPSLRKPSELLPISRHRQSLLYAIETYPVVILVGETGSGKTTQLPQFLDQAGWSNNNKQIAVTQPRRVAATSVAARVAEEMHCELGQEVGYSIRFEDVTSAVTRIKFLTDGLLLREALVDPLLSRYSVIMVDEAHERSISTDVLLGVLKKIRKRRPELRIIISSATLQAKDYGGFFAADDLSGKDPDSENPVNPVATIVALDGKAYPVECLYLQSPTEHYVARAVKTVFDIHTSEDDGDILLFLTGRDEIDDATQRIYEQAAQLDSNAKQLTTFSLHAGLTAEEQLGVFEPAPENTRKVIVSTNIAEASVTIEGVVFIIDCGYAKIRAYDALTGIEKLITVPISKASAIQRAGRAGRTSPGKCFRLYTEKSYTLLPDMTVPEIQRSNLTPIVLQLKALGIDNIARFDFISPPQSKLVIRALQTLYSLGALDDQAKLSKPLGAQMAELSIDPMMAKVLLASPSFGCMAEMLSIAAMTSLQGSVWFHHDNEKKAMESSRRKFAVEEGDHLTYLNIYRAFVSKEPKDIKWCRANFLNHKELMKAVTIRAQLKRYLARFGIEPDLQKPSATVNAENIQKCLASGYFAHAAKMQPDGSFIMVSGTILYAHPSSLMFNRKADWVIFNEILETSGKTYIKDITKVEKDWLLELAPDYYQVGI